MRYQDRAHAISSIRNFYGERLRQYETVEEMRDFLTRRIDLADLPDALADKYNYSDRAWHLFLNDIIRDAGAWPGDSRR
jgi:hypothetical protein